MIPRPPCINPVPPVTLEVRYNAYQHWRIPIERPGVVTIISMMGPSSLYHPPGTRRREPKSVRQAIDWATGKSPVSVRRDEHMEVLTYHFHTLDAANKALKRVERIKEKDYQVSARLYATTRRAVERAKRRIVA